MCPYWINDIIYQKKAGILNIMLTFCIAKSAEKQLNLNLP